MCRNWVSFQSKWGGKNYTAETRSGICSYGHPKHELYIQYVLTE